MAGATILHVDLDAFYVSMELLRRPELRARPVIVCGGLGPRGVVNTCSYEARRFGVHSAMPTAQARRLCPQGVYLPSDFAYYAPASRHFHAILREYTPRYEPAGADEAYLDVAGSERLFGEPRDIATAIRRRVREEIGIAASIGVATNKLVAKVASDAAKPDGLLVVPPGTEAEFLAPRPIRHLPMVGRKTEEALARLGIRTIGDLAAYPPELLAERFGSHGRELSARARGQYRSPVLAGRGPARSVSRETTFETDVAGRDRLRAVLRTQAERVAADLAATGRAARTVTLKLRFPPFETLTRSSTGHGQVELADEIYGAAVDLFERAWRDNGRRPVRLIGLGVTNLEERARQLRLGESIGDGHLAEAVQAIRSRFGDVSVRRAAELRPPSRRHVAAPPGLTGDGWIDHA